MKHIHPIALVLGVLLLTFVILVMCVFSAAVEVESKYATWTQESYEATATFGAEQFLLQQFYIKLTKTAEVP